VDGGAEIQIAAKWVAERWERRWDGRWRERWYLNTEMSLGPKLRGANVLNLF